MPEGCQNPDSTLNRGFDSLQVNACAWASLRLPHAAAFRRRRRHETVLLFDRADAVDPFTERFVDALDDAEDYPDR